MKCSRTVLCSSRKSRTGLLLWAERLSARNATNSAEVCRAAVLPRTSPVLVLIAAAYARPSASRGGRPPMGSRASETGFEQAGWLPIPLGSEIPLWRVRIWVLVRLERTGFPQKHPLSHEPVSAGQSFVAASSIASSAGSSSATVFQSRSKSTPQ